MTSPPTINTFCDPYVLYRSRLNSAFAKHTPARAFLSIDTEKDAWARFFQKEGGKEYFDQPTLNREEIVVLSTDHL